MNKYNNGYNPIKKATFIIVLLITLAFNAFAQKTNFIGIWALNEGKTEFGEVPHDYIPQRFEVSQDEKQVTIKRISLDENNKEVAISESLKSDGTPAETVLPNKLTRTASLKWKADNQSFVLKSSSINSDSSDGADITEVWSITDEGKTLFIRRSVEQADGGRYEILAYYDKK